MATGTLASCASPTAAGPAAALAPRPLTRAREDFFFLQLSDTHWGFKGPPNPHVDVTLEHTGKVTHHSARSLVFPLPLPGSVPKKAPLAWDPESPDHGLGWRQVAMDPAGARIEEVAFH